MRPDELQHAARAAEMVVEIHREIAPWLRTGMTLGRIDQRVGELLAQRKVRSAFQGYQLAKYPRFPSHACLSVNDVIVHGMAGMSLDPLKRGDVLSIDIGVIYNGWMGDAAWTYVFEEADDVQRRLCECGVEALRRGVRELQPGARLENWARAVQRCVEGEYGFHCVAGLGGHQYGRRLHEPPHVANALPEYPGDWPDAGYVLEPGLLLAVEPIIAVGTSETTQKPRQWPIRTADGSLAVHYEHDVFITPDGPRVLTAGLEELPLIVG